MAEPVVWLILSGLVLTPMARQSHAAEATAQDLDCKRYGDTYRPLFDLGSCFKTDNLFDRALVINDPDNVDGKRGAEFDLRLRSDIKVLKDADIGQLSAFFRLQADYDPSISEDYVAALSRRDFAVGLEAFELRLDREGIGYILGKVENAGATVVSNGFTDRGAESLNARSSLGAALERSIAGFHLRFSLSDPRATTDASPISPNFGVGVSRKLGAFEAGIGAALINVDDISNTARTRQAVSSGAPVEVAARATFGYGLGIDVKHAVENLKTFIGLTYAKGASNDVVFSFADGFDALTLYAGLSRKLTRTITFNADFSYVTAVEKGFRNENGFDTAANFVWQPVDDWKFLAEIGFDNVDSFGAGDGFFFELEPRADLSFLFQVSHIF